MIKVTTTSTSFPWSAWIFNNFLGWFVGVLLVLGMVLASEALGLEGVQFFVGTGMGLGLGLFQQRLLKRHYSIGKHWSLYTTLGLSLPFIGLDIVNALNTSGPLPYFLPVCVVIAGLLIGLVQSKIVRPLHITRRIWTIGSILAWLLAGLSVYAIEFTRDLLPDPRFQFGTNLSLILIGGLIHGVVTGLMLKRAKPLS